MFGKGGLGNLMKQAQQMQEKMQKMQEEIAQLEVTGESGAGLVKVTINGAHNCRRVEIDPSLLEDDKEMLEDLVAAAFNDAARRIEETQKEKMASVSSGMQLPPGFKDAVLMQTSPLLTQLMEALRCLPGVGPKSAQRVWRSRCFSAIVAAGCVWRRRSPGRCRKSATAPIAALSPNRKSVTSVRIRVVRKTVKSAWWRVRRTFTPLSRRGSFQVVILC